MAVKEPTDVVLRRFDQRMRNQITTILAHAYPGNWQLLYMAVSNAIINWAHSGGQTEVARRKEQAQTLRAAMEVVGEYRDIVEHNMEGRVIHDSNTGKTLTLVPWLVPDSPVGAGAVLNMVADVVYQLSHDLENRNPEGMRDRADASLYYVIGRELKLHGLPSLSVSVSREIVRLVAPDHSDPDDAGVINAMRRGATAL